MRKLIVAHIRSNISKYSHSYTFYLNLLYCCKQQFIYPVSNDGGATQCFFSHTLPHCLYHSRVRTKQSVGAAEVTQVPATEAFQNKSPSTNLATHFSKLNSCLLLLLLLLFLYNYSFYLLLALGGHVSPPCLPRAPTPLPLDINKNV